MKAPLIQKQIGEWYWANLSWWQEKLWWRKVSRLEKAAEALGLEVWANWGTHGIQPVLGIRIGVNQKLLGATQPKENIDNG